MTRLGNFITTAYNLLVRIDYQRISEEMYESRKDHEPRSTKVMIVGLILIIILFVAAILFFGIIYLSLMREFRGF